MWGECVCDIVSGECGRHCLETSTINCCGATESALQRLLSKLKRYCDACMFIVIIMKIIFTCTLALLNDLDSAGCMQVNLSAVIWYNYYY